MFFRQEPRSLKCLWRKEGQEPSNPQSRPTSPKACQAQPSTSQPASLASLGLGVHRLVAWGCLGREFQGPVHLQKDLERGLSLSGGQLLGPAACLLYGKGEYPSKGQRGPPKA